MKFCQECNSNKDVISFYRGDDQLTLCLDCRSIPSGAVAFTTGVRPSGATRGKQKTTRPNGRPSMGITKKVSLTLPDETWKWLDEQAGENRSALIRSMINRERSAEREWSNNATLGYAIMGAERLGYDKEQMKMLVRAIYCEFDLKSVEQAKNAYNEFFTE
ncbi:ribbon-helix-helix domain-containing protein [Paenibacillus whitsoniae]|nr:ribbon-helix-helix domain-containing protein [Paenibacillus whitsoniae]